MTPSDQQARRMRAAARDAGFARRMGIDRDVAREAVAADEKRPPRQAGPTRSEDERKRTRYGGE